MSRLGIAVKVDFDDRGIAKQIDFADFDALNTRAGTLGIVLEDGGARESGQAIQGEFTVRLR